jgi:GTP pyrophosphokinase
VEDFDSIMIKFARCCTPVPGDDIVGFITKGYGVSIHRRDCPNARQAAEPTQAGRWVNVSWSDQPTESFVTSLEVYAVDRDALILDIATVMTGMRLKVTELNARLLPEKQSLVSLSFEVKDLSQLNSVSKKLQMISGVTDVRRGHS